MTHTLTVVYGGMWGSEGKGDVVAAITRRHASQSLDQIMAIRVGGPNAGHTILDDIGEERKLQSMPVSAFCSENVISVLGASAVILPDLLAREIRWLSDVRGDDLPSIVIDRLATVIFPHNMWEETGMKESIGSTGEGVGSATAAKVMRSAWTFQTYLNRVMAAGTQKNGQKELPFFAHESDEVWKSRVDDAMYISARVVFDDTVSLINNALVWQTKGLHVIVEGTQGVLLSLNTSGNYPYVTSRDCTPEALLGQIGITDRAFDETNYVCVLRTFPIRVGGNSGPLPHEIDWDTLMAETGGYIKRPERTTVTKKIRRIGRWDWETVHKVLTRTRPTEIALTFVDYLFPASNEYTDFVSFANGCPDATDWLLETKLDMGVPLSWIGVGPHQMIDIQGNLEVDAEPVER